MLVFYLWYRHDIIALHTWDDPPRAREGDVAASPPCMSMWCRYHPLGKVQVVRWHPHRPRPRPCLSSWSPSLLAPSARVGVLILFCTDEASRSSPTACRTTEPKDLLVLSDAPERGWTRKQPTLLPGSCCALYVLVRRWGGPSPVLAPCLACLPGEPRVLVPLWHHQGNPMFHYCDTHINNIQSCLNMQEFDINR